MGGGAGEGAGGGAGAEVEAEVGAEIDGDSLEIEAGSVVAMWGRTQEA